MRFIRDVKEKIANSRWFRRLKQVKNVEIVIAVILAIISAVCYFAVSANSSSTASKTVSSVSMTDSEARLSEMISDISGVGRSRVLITTDSEKRVIGVVVVAEGAKDTTNRIKMIRCVEKATGATVDQIEIFEMNGG